MSKTIQQKTNGEGFPKAGELIEIGGAGSGQLTLADRVVLNLLYEHAANRIGEDVEHEILAVDLRRHNGHTSNDRLRDSLRRLRSIEVDIPSVSPRTGKPTVVFTHLFDFTEIEVDDEDPAALVRYGFSKKVRGVLARSKRWGRIKAEVVCAMTSKYAVRLYELIQLRAGMDKASEEIPLDRFRQLLGVEDGKLERGPDFLRFVMQPAVLEVNGLSDMGVELEPLRRGHSERGKLVAVRMTWWRKDQHELREAIRELDRPKVGRQARLKGEAEKVEAVRAELRDATAREYASLVPTSGQVAISFPAAPPQAIRAAFKAHGFSYRNGLWAGEAGPWLAEMAVDVLTAKGKVERR